MKRRNCILILTLYFIGAGLYGQNRKIDSLRVLNQTEKSDTNRVLVLAQLCHEYSFLGELDSAIEFGQQSLEIAKKLNYKKGLSTSLYEIGLIQMYQGNYPEALQTIFSSLRLSEEAKDKKAVAICYITLGSIYYYQYDLDEALNYYSLALKLNQTIGNKDGVATAYIGIGAVHESKKEDQKALDNYFAALKIKEETGADKDRIGILYMNIGNIYAASENYSVALINLKKSLEIRKSAGNKGGIAVSNISLGNLYIKLDSLKKAKIFLNEGLRLIKETGNKEWTKNAYAGLLILDSLNSDYKSAFEHQRLFFLYRDSLINDANNKKSIQAKLQYEYDKKTMQDKLEQEKIVFEANQKSQRQRLITYFVAGFLIIVIVFSFFLYKKFSLTKKQKHIIEEKSKEITDSINYAKRIQYTLLAHNEFLSRNLPDHFVFFKPKDIVSGDFYWATSVSNAGSKVFHEGVAGGTQNKAYQIPTDTFFLSVCDSTGHGVPGAFMSLLNISFLNEAISERKILKPNEIFDYVRERLVESVSQNGGKDGMDGILISKSEDTIFYAAANNAPVLVSDGKIKELNKDKMPIGFGERKQSFSLNEIEYQKRDMIYLYTDGFADQFGGERGKKYKYKQLNEFLSSISTLSMDEQKVKLDEEFHRWKGELEQVDDVCVIGIRL